MAQPDDEPTLDAVSLGDDPLAAFGVWLDDARAADQPLPEMTVLATADVDGRPSARAVLLRAVDAEAVVFYTNYDSRKGRELDANPYAAVCTVWPDLQRQIRMEGAVARVDPERSDAYWGQRPFKSRLAAAASAQSQVIASRDQLERETERLARRHPDGDIPRPSTWGGFALQPQVVEFWQGRAHRLHDRLRFRRGPQGWLVERLAP